MRADIHGFDIYRLGTPVYEIALFTNLFLEEHLSPLLFMSRSLEDQKAEAGNANGNSAFSAADKNARALRKKLKQVDALFEKQKAGFPLTNPEKDKIMKADHW